VRGEDPVSASFHGTSFRLRSGCSGQLARAFGLITSAVRSPDRSVLLA